MTVSYRDKEGGRMEVAYPKAAYAGGLEAVNEWVSKALSEMFDQREF